MKYRELETAVGTVVAEPVTFAFEPEPGALPKDVSFMMAFDGDERAVPDTVLFMGFGNEGVAPARAVAEVQRLGGVGLAAVQGLPYWEAVPDERGIFRLAVQASQAAISHARDHYGAKRLNGIGESQAGPALLETVVADETAIDGRVALLRALGFQGVMSVIRFGWGMSRTALQADQLRSPRTTASAAGHAMLRVGQDMLRRQGRGAQLRFAMSHDAFASLKTVSRSHEVGVFVADDDLVFRAMASRDALTTKGHADLLKTVKGGHSSPASPAGARQVKEVLKWCQS